MLVIPGMFDLSTPAAMLVKAERREEKGT